ncbi:hypothetical protein C5S36_15855, partial [Candidatus Methanophagaceae archaeon]
ASPFPLQALPCFTGKNTVKKRKAFKVANALDILDITVLTSDNIAYAR